MVPPGRRMGRIIVVCKVSRLTDCVSHDVDSRQGPVRFHTNQTNSMRTLNVLRNLTAEFTQSLYGGVVTGEWASVVLRVHLSDAWPMRLGIELMNEPRVSDDGFTMEYLKSFYTNATEVVQTAAQGRIQIVVHGT